MPVVEDGFHNGTLTNASTGLWSMNKYTMVTASMVLLVVQEQTQKLDGLLAYACHLIVKGLLTVGVIKISI